MSLPEIFEMTICIMTAAAADVRKKMATIVMSMLRLGEYKAYSRICKMAARITG